MLQSQTSNAVSLKSFTLRGAANGLWTALLRWQDRASGRHHMAKLDKDALKDVGLTEAEIYKEYSKPVWRR